jgi:hypothetical protein
LGQYIIYSNILEELQPDCSLYLAIRQATYRQVFTEPIRQMVVQKNHIKLIVFNPKQEVITQWIH